MDDPLQHIDACMSDCERSTHTRFTRMNNPYLDTRINVNAA